ncbi:MAG: branched-chain amino acid ABC transporter permease [Candidatus Velthaea sp.]
MILTVLVSGIAIGAVYAATALVYNVMFSTSKVLSVATGQIVMLGSVSGAWFLTTLHVPVLLALAGSIAVGAAFGVVMELIAVRRIVARSDEHLWLLSTLAVGTMVQQLVALWWGTEPKPFPRMFPQGFDAGFLDQKYWIPIAVVALVAIGLEYFYRSSLYGKIFVATSEDAFAARARGISTDRVRIMSYLLAGALGGLAGFGAGQLTFAYFALGFNLTLNGFIALAVGGLGNNAGAVIGGLALGVLSSFASYYFGGQYQQTVAVGLLMIVLIIRPAGLFGTRSVRPV